MDSAAMKLNAAACRAQCQPNSASPDGLAWPKLNRVAESILWNMQSIYLLASNLEYYYTCLLSRLSRTTSSWNMGKLQLYIEDMCLHVRQKAISEY